MIQLEDKAWDVLLIVLGVLISKALDEGIESLKKKTPTSGEHFKRS